MTDIERKGFASIVFAAGVKGVKAYQTGLETDNDWFIAGSTHGKGSRNGAGTFCTCLRPIPL